jgi:selenocysteine lyase/cysteine desulfurase
MAPSLGRASPRLQALARQLQPAAAAAAASSEVDAAVAAWAPSAESWATVRAEFPALATMEETGEIFFENAGGSQLPLTVIDAVREYMLTSYVQLGAPYARSDQAGGTVQAARDFATTFVGGEGVGECYLGPSSTSCAVALAEGALAAAAAAAPRGPRTSTVLCAGRCLLYTVQLAVCLHTDVAIAYAQILEPGDKIIVEEAGHEANIGPWVRLGERCAGVEVEVWEVERNDAAVSPLAPLEAMLAKAGGAVKLVAVAHVSNILGQILPLDEVVAIAHKYGARVVCDGVAYAAHRLIDVQESGVDFYFWSPYKVFAPHMGCMFGTTEAFQGLVGPNHFFMPRDSVPQVRTHARRASVQYSTQMKIRSDENVASTASAAAWLALIYRCTRACARTCVSVCVCLCVSRCLSTASSCTRPQLDSSPLQRSASLFSLSRAYQFAYIRHSQNAHAAFIHSAQLRSHLYCELHNNRPKTAETSAIRVS